MLTPIHSPRFRVHYVPLSSSWISTYELQRNHKASHNIHLMILNLITNGMDTFQYGDYCIGTSAKSYSTLESLSIHPWEPQMGNLDWTERSTDEDNGGRVLQ